MLNHDVNVVNMSNEIKSHTKREFKNSYIHIIFLIGLFQLSMEGIVSQNLYLGPSFNFIKSRKCRWKK